MNALRYVDVGRRYANGGMQMSNAVVIRGGIAGIQSALDITRHNIHVWLIEHELSIGGHMAMLDKTFPTNDCSMCILSLVVAEFEMVESFPGHYCVTVKNIRDISMKKRGRGRFLKSKLIQL